VTLEIFAISIKENDARKAPRQSVVDVQLEKC